MYNNWKQGHTGPLSVITSFLLFAGAAARTFTTLQDVNDPLLVGGFACAVVLNGTMLAQIFLYWGATRKFLAGVKAAQQKKKAK